MLPRTDVRFLSETMDRNEAAMLLRESGHSRFPFSSTADLGGVAGVVLAKDLLYWLLPEKVQNRKGAGFISRLVQ